MTLRALVKYILLIVICFLLKNIILYHLDLEQGQNSQAMTDAATELSDLEVKKPVKEVPVVQDQGFFQHDTGDTYDGFFEAKKKDRSVKMHGPGVYKTAEGDIYSGMWENDRLGANEQVAIAFTDSSKFEGLFKDWCYTGAGRYIYPDCSILQCDFTDNCPMGNLVLTDPNGHTWLGRAEQGYGWFEPVNHFYAMLEKTRESSKVKRKHKDKDKGASGSNIKSDARSQKSVAAVKSSVRKK